MKLFKNETLLYTSSSPTYWPIVTKTTFYFDNVPLVFQESY